MGEDDQVTEEMGTPDPMAGSLEALLGPSLGYDPEAEAEQPEQPAEPSEEVETVKLNGKEWQVPKDVASALAQGRRFQGDKDRLEEANRRQQQDVADLRQQMQQMQQMLMQGMQQRSQPQSPTGPSPIQQAFAQADEAVAAGSGILKGLGSVVEQYITANNQQMASKLDQILQASQQQQTRLQEIGQQAHVNSLQRDVVDAIQYRQKEDGVELTPEQQQLVASRLMALQEGSGYNRDLLREHFAAAYFQTAFEAAKQGGVKPPAPAMVFNRRPPVNTPIIPRNPGSGAAVKRDANLPSTVDLLQG